VNQILAKIGTYTFFQIFKAFLIMFFWNMSIPNILESVSEITWLESFYILIIYDIMTKINIKIFNGE
jgi:hypothetical protein